MKALVKEDELLILIIQLTTKPPPPLEVVEANYKQLPNRQEL